MNIELAKFVDSQRENLIDFIDLITNELPTVELIGVDLFGYLTGLLTPVAQKCLPNLTEEERQREIMEVVKVYSQRFKNNIIEWFNKMN